MQATDRTSSISAIFILKIVFSKHFWFFRKESAVVFVLETPPVVFVKEDTLPPVVSFAKYQRSFSKFSIRNTAGLFAHEGTSLGSSITAQSLI